MTTNNVRMSLGRCLIEEWGNEPQKLRARNGLNISSSQEILVIFKLTCYNKY